MYMSRKRGMKRIKKPKDNCQMCNGDRGGVLGNEIIHTITVDKRGVQHSYTMIVCDYCHSEHFT